MKIRDSGMPEEDAWDAFFDPAAILQRLGLAPGFCQIVEFGCGYGTFTTAAAQLIDGTVRALDIDAAMIGVARKRAESLGLTNIEFIVRDFVADGTGLADGSADYAMLFNILHCEDPVGLLREAQRNLGANGVAGVIHWNYDAETPRGPPLSVRPRPGQIGKWGRDAGFATVGEIVDLPPHHYGLVLRQTEN